MMTRKEVIELAAEAAAAALACITTVAVLMVPVVAALH